MTIITGIPKTIITLIILNKQTFKDVQLGHPLDVLNIHFLWLCVNFNL